MSLSDGTLSRISRRSFLAGTVALCALDYDVLRAGTTVDTPTVIRGPYIQRTTETSVVVMWRTDIECDTRVNFGTEAGKLDLVFYSTALETDHIARIIGLQPNTKYYYDVGTDDEVLDGGTPEHYFITAPTIGEAKPTRIWVLGDIGWPTGELRGVRDHYYAYTGNRHTDICLLLGDIAYSHGRDREYQAPLFDMFKDLIRHTATWPTYGNHDSYCSECDSTTNSGPYFNIFKVPTIGQAGGTPSYTKAYYSFAYGNIHLISLNSTDWPKSNMLEWLNSDLLNSESNWTIVFWHHPAYSRGAYDSDVTSDLAWMRTEVMPILEQHGVDLVLSGHNHCYERSFLINGHYGTAETLTDDMIIDGGDGDNDGMYRKPSWSRQPNEGAVHIAMGCSSIIKEGTLDHPAMYKSISNYGSLVIDIVDNQLQAQMLGHDGNIIDKFIIEKEGRSYFPIIP